MFARLAWLARDRHPRATRNPGICRAVGWVETIMTTKHEPQHHRDDELQNATVRRGGEAAGGIAPHPGDPTSPDLADARAEERDKAQAEHGFGDDGAQSVI
jgi:hypothetical protein